MGERSSTNGGEAIDSRQVVIWALKVGVSDRGNIGESAYMRR